MHRRGLKPVVFVELSGPLVECMHEQRSHPSVLGYGHCAVNSVPQQRCSQMLSLHPAVDREPGEYHDRNRIGHVASYAACCQLVRNGAGCHSVVAADATVLIGDDKGTARPASLVGQCPALEPVIEHGLAALEVIQSMRSRQGLRWTELQAQAFANFLPQRALTAMRRSSPGLRAGGASSSLLNCRNFPASNLKNT